jgi:hypothetical protein
MDPVLDMLFDAVIKDVERHRNERASQSNMATPPAPSGASVCLLKVFVDYFGYLFLSLTLS